MRKGAGKEAKLCYGAYALMENRNGLLVDLHVTTGNRDVGAGGGRSACSNGRRASAEGSQTLGADKGYDTHDFIAMLRSRKITPHVAANTKRRGGSVLDGRTTRHATYQVSQRIRKRVKKIFGWVETIGGFRKTRYKGQDLTFGLVGRCGV